jgi:uncharacterized damage-inducible protein DinB
MHVIARAAATAALLIPTLLAAQSPSGFRGDLLRDLATLEQKYVSLAEAIPESSYDWRPAEGVRSIGEVYAHIANGNYYFSGLFAEGRPADVGVENAPQNLEQVTGKARIVALLEHVFPHVREAIESTPDSELDSEVTLFGQQSTVRAAMLILMTHMHEHLGQSIAYARSVGVTPPWSG